MLRQARKENTMERMELKEFYSKLYGLDLVWQQLTAMVGAIRRHQNGVGTWCPITAVAESETGTHYTIWDWGRAAKDIGLQSGDAQGIVDAADAIPADHFSGHPKRVARQEEIRKELLEATGLQEWVINEGLPPEEAKI
jgi:hypothetical protein